MLSSERRLSALEAAAYALDDELKIICVLPDETEEVAAGRAGYPPQVHHQLRLLFVSPVDMLL
ncbi:hypothetical protein [Variovorax guangxiensis]|uniref:Uncharacterized protein n=1 Tax=Variovorax guangxiensis TaxID=1775474 RepID=A0A840GA23_9BURK|nr:hypothetical protein [Variovorax guangxiensis]MBB4226031.1 hypothetical protein [Variovorax guangxiensis]